MVLALHRGAPLSYHPTVIFAKAASFPSYIWRAKEETYEKDVLRYKSDRGSWGSFKLFGRKAH